MCVCMCGGIVVVCRLLVSHVSNGSKPIVAERCIVITISRDTADVDIKRASRTILLSLVCFFILFYNMPVVCTVEIDFHAVKK